MFELHINGEVFKQYFLDDMEYVEDFVSGCQTEFEIKRSVRLAIEHAVTFIKTQNWDAITAFGNYEIFYLRQEE